MSEQRVPVQTFEVTAPDVAGSAKSLGKFLADHPTVKLVGHHDPLVVDRVLSAIGMVRLQATRKVSRDELEPVDILLTLTPAAAG